MAVELGILQNTHAVTIIACTVVRGCPALPKRIFLKNHKARLKAYFMFCNPPKIMFSVNGRIF